MAMIWMPVPSMVIHFPRLLWKSIFWVVHWSMMASSSTRSGQSDRIDSLWLAALFLGCPPIHRGTGSLLPDLNYLAATRSQFRSILPWDRYVIERNRNLNPLAELRALRCQDQSLQQRVEVHQLAIDGDDFDCHCELAKLKTAMRMATKPTAKDMKT